MATVQGILADVNIQGHLDFIVALLRSGTWSAIWRELNLRYAHFGELGLDPRSKDSVVWQLCQDQGYVLITSNRNESGIDSLETTIRQRNTAQSLPVLTVSDPERFHEDRPYVEKVLETLVDTLLDIDAYRGTGRLYLP